MNSGKVFVGLCALAALAGVGWWVGGRLTPNALALALGVILGLMAGIPAALIALSADRRVRVDHVHRIETSKKAQDFMLPRVAIIYTAIAANAPQRPALSARASNSDQGGVE